MSNKLAIVGVAAAAAIAFLLGRKAEAEEELVTKGKVSIEIFDMAGNPVPHNSPADLMEGFSYTIQVKITNLTTRGGAAYEATLDHNIYCWAGYYVFIPTTSYSNYYFAGEVKSLLYTINIPVGSAGSVGNVRVTVTDPDLVLLAEATENITIISGISYAAGLDVAFT